MEVPQSVLFQMIGEATVKARVREEQLRQMHEENARLRAALQAHEAPAADEDADPA